MLSIEHLCKSFGSLRAVDDISFEVKESEIFGFVGPNGAGKTTTINLICSLLKPDSGQIIIDGIECGNGGIEVKRKLGVVPQDIAVYEDLNARENLKFWGSLYDISGKELEQRVSYLLELTGLQERAKEQVKNFSGGMKRRLNMAAGMIHKPKLLLLDEPTIGIDPQARHNMLAMVKDVAREGTTILYTSHYLDEIEELCSRLAIIDHGRILAQGTVDEVKRIVGENRVLQVTGTFSRQTAEQLAGQIENLSLLSIAENQVVYSLPIQYGTGEFLEKLVKAGFEIDNVSIKEPSLDSVFIKLTGREFKD
jgi:ABC-2 type transport system ATP-binding protein